MFLLGELSAGKLAKQLPGGGIFVGLRRKSRQANLTLNLNIENLAKQFFYALKISPSNFSMR